MDVVLLATSRRLVSNFLLSETIQANESSSHPELVALAGQGHQAAKPRGGQDALRRAGVESKTTWFIGASNHLGTGTESKRNETLITHDHTVYWHSSAQFRDICFMMLSHCSTATFATNTFASQLP